jgi:hypothetical protein
MHPFAIRLSGLEARRWPPSRATVAPPPCHRSRICIVIGAALLFLFAGAAGNHARSQNAAAEAPSDIAAPPDRPGSQNDSSAPPPSAPPLETLSTTASRISEESVTSPARADAVRAYLWSVYRRSSTKVDSHGEFTWKDVAAAINSGLLVEDYVIGGMDPDFRELLFAAGHAMDAAGVAWTILSAFRDDFRQNAASGLKARVNNSFHGGSGATGGYGHGCAVDLASVDRLSDDKVWSWLDRKGREFGLYRPLRAADPAHVLPTAGWHELGAMLVNKRLGTSAESDPALAGDLVTLEQYLCVRPLSPEKPAPGTQGAEASRHPKTQLASGHPAKRDTNSRADGPPQKLTGVHEAQAKQSGSHDARRVEAKKHATPK